MRVGRAPETGACSTEVTQPNPTMSQTQDNVTLDGDTLVVQADFGTCRVEMADDDHAQENLSVTDAEWGEIPEAARWRMLLGQIEEALAVHRREL